MGVWGVGPFDNDSAADMICLMLKPVHRVVRSKTNEKVRYEYLEARAIAQIVLLAHPRGPYLETVLRALVRMRSDGEWLGTWREPQSVMMKLNAEIMEVLIKMRTCKASREAYRSEELSKLVSAAYCTKPIMTVTRKRRSVPKRRKKK